MICIAVSRIGLQTLSGDAFFDQNWTLVTCELQVGNTLYLKKRPNFETV